MLNIIKKIYKLKLLFYILTIPVRMFDLLFIKNKDEIVFYGYHGRYNGNAKVLYEYYLKNNSSLLPVWLLDEKDKNFFNGKSHKYYFLPNKNCGVWSHINFFIKLFKAKVIVVTSVGDLHIYRSMLSKRKYFEILLPHGITLKSFGIMAKHLTNKQKKIWIDVPKRFDLISVASRVEQYWTSAGFRSPPQKIKIIGPQRRDVLPLKISNNDKLYLKKTIISSTSLNIDDSTLGGYTFIIYAPTHRDHKLDEDAETLLHNLEGFNINILDEFLLENDIILFLREHMVAQLNIKNDINDYKAIYYLSPLDVPDIDSLIYGFDLLITDYSGIYLELLQSDMSLAFIPYDLEEYEKERGLILPADTISTGYTITSQKEFIYYLQNRISIDKSYESKREYLSSLLFEVKHGDSCRKTKNEIDKIVNNV
jgi:CDP-glycerol glycerophosphotransferase